jgi:hypothetical protein
VTGGCGPTWWGRPTPPGIARWPHPRCHITDLGECLHTASPTLIHVGLIQRWRLSCLRSMGPLSFTWGGCQNRPPNRLPDRSNQPTFHATALGSHQALLDGKAVQGTVSRHPLGWSMPLPLHHLSSAYKYPLPSTQYKGAVVLGEDHHSRIPSIPSSPRSSQE